MRVCAFGGIRVRGVRLRSPMALSPKQKRSSAATPSSALRARKKLSNTRGVSSNTFTRGLGRFTSFSGCRREKDSSYSEPDFQRKFRRKCRIQVDWLFSSCRHRHDPQPRTPATKSSIAVLSPRLFFRKKPFGEHIEGLSCSRNENDRSKTMFKRYGLSHRFLDGIDITACLAL